MSTIPSESKCQHSHTVHRNPAPRVLADGEGESSLRELRDRLRAASVDRSLAMHSGQDLIRAIGEDESREGLIRTPERFAKAMADLCAGYGQSVSEVVGEGVFSGEGNGVVAVRNIEFYSLCEHHILPFWGRVSVAYIPSGKILGLSKIPRIIDVFARRLQVQERITEQVADALVELISPKAVLVRVQAQHLCMMMRGVEKQQSDTVTEALRGVDRLSDAEARRFFEAITL